LESLNATSRDAEGSLQVLGVIAARSDENVIGEFFELFKTPWEFYSGAREYSAVLCAGNSIPDGKVAARLVLVYAGHETSFDKSHGIDIASARDRAISFADITIPIYGDFVSILQQTESAVDACSPSAIAFVARLTEPRFVRVGYDLFSEVRALLNDGQPAENAITPTLDLHIALLRRIITGCGLPLAEVPPIPEGFPFIACLTHDLDHAVLRRHKVDATVLGFLYRATVASALKTARGRLRPRKLLENWVAAAKLPFVYAGLAQDFWLQFDRYLDMEKGRPSTFFAIPFERKAGQSPSGQAPAARASAYDVSHIAEKIRVLKAAGCEIGLHGIDAWRDSSSGREEAARISAVSGDETVGVRMHWLYRDEKSPLAWEEAGFSYDSTVGYNETVGYRAGTVQVFRPPQVSRLLELPLHVMDTALFYPDYLGLSDSEAWDWLRPIFENAVRYGGVLTINWHDRSIAPERQWGEFYCRILEELTNRGALFCTASKTVAWFEKRRSVTFEPALGGTYRTAVSDECGEGTPGLRLRLYNPGARPATFADVLSARETFIDTPLQDGSVFRLPS
jgi:hypothetical protein